MPTFDTPDPIRARIDLSAGTVRVHATPRSDTVVEVRPGDDRSAAARQAAFDTRVEFADGTLVVRSPRRARLLFFNTGPSVEVDVSLPERSAVDISTTAGDVECDGLLGDVTVNCRYGGIGVDSAGRVRAGTATGDITLRHVDTSAEASTAYGEIRIGDAEGDLRLSSACGDITVDQALGSVGANTKYGEIRVHEAVRGSLDLETAYGGIRTGVRRGTAAWLDVAAASGTVRNSLSATDGPDDAEDTLRIHARTAYGDIVIRHA
jgi:DUF4097 and DUF4098 domain-containing protein YvlB